MDLKEKSLKIILDNQSETGAFVASPAFAHYSYSWLRDGTFIAYALDLYGEHEAARNFYQWVNRVVVSRGERIHNLLRRKSLGEEIPFADFLHTRYTLTGEEVNEPWGNFQLDGYGTWLWGLNEHLRLTGQSVEEYREAIYLSAEYLRAFWQLPNYDCWEENPEHVHTATLAAVAAGLKAAGNCLGEEVYIDKALEIRDYISIHGVREGHLVKFVKEDSLLVDSSLLWVSVPFGLWEVDSELIKNTVWKIEEDLLGGGLRRYVSDTYYGGGEWILLTAWLAWYYNLIGNDNKAEKLIEWIEEQSMDGELPEQVPGRDIDKNALLHWQEEWGPSASPLLWSHAMYLIALAGKTMITNINNWGSRVKE